MDYTKAVQQTYKGNQIEIGWTRYPNPKIPSSWSCGWCQGHGTIANSIGEEHCSLCNGYGIVEADRRKFEAQHLDKYKKGLDMTPQEEADAWRKSMKDRLNSYLPCTLEQPLMMVIPPEGIIVSCQRHPLGHFLRPGPTVTL